MGKNNEYFIRSTIFKDEATGKYYQKEERVKKLLKWKVINGYQPTDYFIVEEDELEKVKYAWATKGIYKLKYSGAEIKKIVPHYNYYVGWADDYTPKHADELTEMRNATPLHLLEERERVADARVKYIATSNKPELLESLEAVDLLLPESDRPALMVERSKEIKKLTSGLVEKFTQK